MSLAAFTTMMSCSAKTSDSNEKERITVSHPEDSVVLNDSTYSVSDVKETIDSLKNNLESVLILRENLISEVDGYIHSVAPRSKMSATNIIDICLQYEYDITMLLCQGHLETHFGTTGRNVFGIVGKRYTHPDQAVQDYVKLMSSKYIINRSTEEVLRAADRRDRRLDHHDLCGLLSAASYPLAKRAGGGILYDPDPVEPDRYDRVPRVDAA